MDRASFLKAYSLFTWILIAISFFYTSLAFFFVVLALIFAKNFIATKLYGPAPATPYGQQPGTQIINRIPKPTCHECGGNNPRDAIYCQDCGTPLDREPQISYDEFR